MDAAPLLSLGLGQDAERCSASPVKELRGPQAIKAQSVGLSLFTCHPALALGLSAPFHTALSQAEDGFVAWVTFVSIFPRPISALCCAGSLGKLCRPWDASEIQLFTPSDSARVSKFVVFHTN